MYQFLCLFFALFLISNSYAAPDKNFHIYLAFGQSNMEGTGEYAAQDRVSFQRIKALQNFTCDNLNREYGRWYVASPPLFSCWGKLSVADYFLREMITGLPQEVSVGIVPVAIGGSDIALFQKGAPIGRGKIGTEKIPEQFDGGYAWLVDLAKIAQQSGVIKGIIFHQGETNNTDPAWKGKVQGIVADLKKDLGLGDIPFLAGELLPKDQDSCCWQHNSEIAQLPERIPNAHVVSAQGLTGADVAHFDSASYRAFGKRYAAIMLPLVGGKPPGSVKVAPGCGVMDKTAVCCNGALTDPDGDGWGWENEKSCKVAAVK